MEFGEQTGRISLLLLLPMFVLVEMHTFKTINDKCVFVSPKGVSNIFRLIWMDRSRFVNSTVHLWSFLVTFKRAKEWCDVSYLASLSVVNSKIRASSTNTRCIKRCGNFIHMVWKPTLSLCKSTERTLRYLYGVAKFQGLYHFRSLSLP